MEPTPTKPQPCVDPNDKQSVACWIAGLLRDDAELYNLVYLELVKMEIAE